MELVKKALYLGNFDLEKGYASVARAFNVATLLSKYGFSTSIACSHATDTSNRKEFADCPFFHFIDRPSMSKKQLYLGTRFYVDLLHQIRPDLVLLFDFPSVPMRKVISCCKKAGVKVISDCTEWFDSKSVDGAVNKIAKVMDTTWRMRFLNKRVDGIICISQYLSNLYKKKKAFVIPPLMQQVPAMEHGDKKPNDIHLFYAGNTTKSKDHLQEICDWMEREQPKDVYLHLFGENHICRKGNEKDDYVSRHIISYGVLPHEQLLSQICNYDCQLILRKDTRANRVGFPSKFAESTVLGIPCFVTEVGDVGTLVRDGENGFVTPLNQIDFDAFIAALRKTDLPKMKENVSKMRSLFLIEDYIEPFGAFLKEVEADA